MHAQFFPKCEIQDSERKLCKNPLQRPGGSSLKEG
jgi:hypothetical protein